MVVPRTVSPVDLEEYAWLAAVIGVGIGLASAVAAIVSAVVAVKARRDARRSADAAERSAHADETLTAMELSGRHENLTPNLRVEAVSWAPGSDGIRLTVRLVGPHGLDRLDGVKIRLRDDKDRSPQVAGGPTQEQIDAAIWGPYRFEPGVDGADRLGRSVEAFSLRQGDERPLYVRPSMRPEWSSPEWWLGEFADQPIRVEIICTRVGDEPWRLVVDVPQPQARFDTRLQRTDAGIELVARNVGEATAFDVSVSVHADAVRFLQEDEAAVLNAGDSIRTMIQATVPLTDSRRDASVDLVWRDQRGAQRRQRIDVVAGLSFAAP